MAGNPSYCLASGLNVHVDGDGRWKRAAGPGWCALCVAALVRCEVGVVRVNKGGSGVGSPVCACGCSCSCWEQPQVISGPVGLTIISRSGLGLLRCVVHCACTQTGPEIRGEGAGPRSTCTCTC